MGLSSITKLTCDLKGKKPCTKMFLLPDPPAKPTPGAENTISSKDAMGNTLFFCSPLHMVAHWVEFIKATPQPKEEQPAPPANVIPFSGKNAASPSLADLQAAGIIEPEVPHAPESLDLEDNL